MATVVTKSNVVAETAWRGVASSDQEHEDRVEEAGRQSVGNTEGWIAPVGRGVEGTGDQRHTNQHDYDRQSQGPRQPLPQPQSSNRADEDDLGMPECSPQARPDLKDRVVPGKQVRSKRNSRRQGSRRLPALAPSHSPTT